MSDDKAVTDVIIERYALHLLNGNSINNTPILVGTIFHYMTAVNDYYKTNRRHPPFDRKGDTNANKLLNKQKEYEDVAAKREPLHDKVILMMKLMADKSSPYGFRRAMWLWTALGRYAGFRRQEFAMERQEIQMYVKPNGDLVVRAFTVKNFIFFDKDGIRTTVQDVRQEERSLFQSVGQQYDVQKNRMNNQIITQTRDHKSPELCPVEISLDIVEVAFALGQQEDDDPLCVFENEEGDVLYLTGDMITKYYRYVTQMVFPTISKDELSLFSCHSIRVKAAVLLQEAGKDGPYIKLRLRWLSDCFEVYLRNTQRICEQHNDAMLTGNEIMLMALTEVSDMALQATIYSEGEFATDVELDDED